MKKPVLIVSHIWWPFGAHLLHVKWARIFAIMNDWDFFYRHNHNACFQNGLVSDFFEDHLSTVTEEEASQRPRISYEYQTENDQVRGAFFPKEFACAKDFHSSVMKSVYLPNQRVRDHVGKNPLVQRLKDKRYVAVHIRLGDKVAAASKETNFIPFEHYMNACNRFADDIDTLVICSDTIDGVRELEKINTKFKEVLYNDEFRPVNDPSQSFVQRVQAGLRDQDFLQAEYLNCFVNCTLLLDAEAVVGNFDSCFVQVPVEMRNNAKDVNVNVSNPPMWGVK